MSSDDRHLGEPNPRAPGWDGALLGVKVLAALMSFAIIVGSGIAWTIYRGFTSNVTVIAVGGPLDKNGKPVTDVDGDDLNILIVGDDSRAGATQAELDELGTTDTETATDNTDTIMVMHVPASGEAASVLSIPRDSWVAIPGHSYGKINSAFAYGKGDAGGDDAGGATLLGQVVYNLTGLRMDHFVKIGMLGFLRVSTAIDGVDLCLNKAQNLSTDSDAEHPEGYTGINLKAGWNYGVQGHQAVAFVRQRHGLVSDISRIQRQQYFLSAAFRKIQSKGFLLNPLKLRDLVTAVSSSLTVDQGLEGTKLLSLATQMSALTAGNLTFITAPNDGGQYRADVGLDVVTLDEVQLRKDVAAFIGHPDAYTSAAPADRGSFPMKVVNDTDGSGAGPVAIAALTSLGFTATAQPSPDVSAATSIQYPPGQEAQAKALAAVVPGAAVVASADVAQVTLVLGNDGATVIASAPGGTTSGPSGAGSTPVPDPGRKVRTGNDADCVD
jgi:LCP family protein required for cell wall assembly